MTPQIDVYKLRRNFITSCTSFMSKGKQLQGQNSMRLTTGSVLYCELIADLLFISMEFAKVVVSPLFQFIRKSYYMGSICTMPSYVLRFIPFTHCPCCEQSVGHSAVSSSPGRLKSPVELSHADTLRSSSCRHGDLMASRDELRN